MERFTDRFDDGTIGIKDCLDRTQLIDILTDIKDDVRCASVGEALEKLFDYEDTGLTPEEIMTFINKFNLIFSDFNTLYFIREDFNTGENRVHEATIDDEMRIQWHDTSYIYFNASDEYGNYHEVSVDSIGAEYFLTREAAEEALKGSEAE